MENFYARTMFFVKDAEASLAYYTQTMGFGLDWNYQHEVFQVSLFGFEIILNQVFGNRTPRAGHGRVFIGVDSEQALALLGHIRERGLRAMRDDWGRPTIVLRDPDENEFFFWIPDTEWQGLDLPPVDEGN